MDIEYTNVGASIASALLTSSSSWARLPAVPTVFSSSDAAVPSVRPSEFGKSGTNKAAKHRLGIGASLPRADAAPDRNTTSGKVLDKRLSRDALRKRRKTAEEADAAKPVVASDSEDDVRCVQLPCAILSPCN
jgi:hypothetical protein